MTFDTKRLVSRHLCKCSCQQHHRQRHSWHRCIILWVITLWPLGCFLYWFLLCSRNYFQLFTAWIKIFNGWIKYMHTPSLAFPLSMQPECQMLFTVLEGVFFLTCVLPLFSTVTTTLRVNPMRRPVKTVVVKLEMWVWCGLWWAGPGPGYEAWWRMVWRRGTALEGSFKLDTDCRTHPFTSSCPCITEDSRSLLTFIMT